MSYLTLINAAPSVVKKWQSRDIFKHNSYESKPWGKLQNLFPTEYTVNCTDLLPLQAPGWGTTRRACRSTATPGPRSSCWSWSWGCSRHHHHVNNSTSASTSPSSRTSGSSRSAAFSSNCWRQMAVATAAEAVVLCVISALAWWAASGWCGLVAYRLQSRWSRWCGGASVLAHASTKVSKRVQ